MKQKYKIIKIVTAHPFAILGVCAKYGPCKIIHNTLYILSAETLKNIKEDIQTMYTMAFKLNIDKSPRSEILSWVEELQIQNLDQQLLAELLKTVRNVNN